MTAVVPEDLAFPGLDPDDADRFIDLCWKISEGELVARVLPKMQWSRRKLYSVIESSDAAREFYSRARINQAHALAEETINIADGTDELGKFYDALADLEAEEIDPKYRGAWLKAFETNRVNRDKHRMAARTWYTSKLAPRLYGEKIDITTNGEPMQSGVVMLPARDAPLTPPADGAVIEQTTRVAVSNLPQQASLVMRHLLGEMKQGRLPQSAADAGADEPEEPVNGDGDHGGAR